MKKFLVLAFALISGMAMAQVTTSAINGKIVDSKGETLAGATVQVLYKPTNTSNGVIANEEGRFNLVNLTPGGPYEVNVTFIGYKAEKFENIFLQLGETLKLDVQLQDEAQTLSEVV